MLYDELTVGWIGVDAERIGKMIIADSHRYSSARKRQEANDRIVIEMDGTAQGGRSQAGSYRIGLTGIAYLAEEVHATRGYRIPGTIGDGGDIGIIDKITTGAFHENSDIHLIGSYGIHLYVGYTKGIAGESCSRLRAGKSQRTGYGIVSEVHGATGGCNAKTGGYRIGLTTITCLPEELESAGGYGIPGTISNSCDMRIIDKIAARPFHKDSDEHRVGGHGIHLDIGDAKRITGKGLGFNAYGSGSQQ